MAREFHKDGGEHYHAYMEHPDRFDWRGTRYLDIDGVHPNIEPLTKTPWHAWAYVRKDGDILIDEIPNEPAGRRAGNRAATETSVWTNIFNSAKDEDDLLTLVKEKLPRDFAKSFNNIQNAAKWSHRRDPNCDTYESPHGLVEHLDAYPDITEWKQRHLPGAEQPALLTPPQSRTGEHAHDTDYSGESFGHVDMGSSAGTSESWDDELSRYASQSDELTARKANEPQARPKSLIIWGRTRMGKTLLARHWGKHSFFNGKFNVDALDTNVQYAVFDDMEGRMKDFPYKKWLGAQHEFTITGKYKKEKRIIWGKPCIWLCNENPYLTEKGVDFNWLRENTVIVNVETPICNFALTHAQL